MTNRFRSLALQVHLYLGLTAGLVIMVLCLSAASLVFEQEITRALHPERYTVLGSGPLIPVRVALDSAAAATQGNIQSILVSSDPARPWEAVGGPGRIYLDPHTGHVLATGPFRLPFFQKAMELHRWLLADDLGEQITGAATVMFVVLLLAGMVLWWPRTKGALKARLNPFAVFSKHGGGRRKLHDLHVALGIWCWPVLFVIALTALPEAYDWAGSAIMAVTGAQRFAPPPKSGGDSTAATLSLDSLVAIGHATFPNARLLAVRQPPRPSMPAAVQAVDSADPSDRHSDIAYLDRVTGQVLRIDRWADQSAGVKFRRMDEWYHTGRAYGLPLRTLWFLAVLFGASFPLTGFLMYRAGKRAA